MIGRGNLDRDIWVAFDHGQERGGFDRVDLLRLPTTRREDPGFMIFIPTTPGRRRDIPSPGGWVAVTEFEGQGPDVVLIHGIGGRAETWWPLIDACAPMIRPITLDLRGHGNSAKPETGYALVDYANDLAAVCDALEMKRPRLIGHSLGALATLEWAVAQPERAAAIVLEDPPLRGAPGGRETLDDWIALNAMTPAAAAAKLATDRPGLTDEAYRRWAESVTDTSPGVYRAARDQFDASTTNPDPFVRIGEIRSPLLVIHGDPEQGSMVHPDDASRLQSLLPSARLARLAGAGHGLHQDHPEAFLRLAIPFLLAN